MLKLNQGLTASAAICSGLLFFTTSIFAATPVDLQNQTASTLQSFMSLQNQTTFKQLGSSVDFNKTQHMRLQQTYAGQPVWGGDFIIHIPQGNIRSLNDINKQSSAISMNGTIYQNLDKDLKPLPLYAMNDTQTDKALQHVISTYQKKSGFTQAVTEQHVNKIIYVDKDNQAHWAFLISFIANPTTMPERPTYIIDAMTFDIYKQWNDIKTLSDTVGGGFGGNEKGTKLVYDGLENNFPKLNIRRDDKKNICYLTNADVTVKNAANSGKIMQFSCNEVDSSHDNIYWNADQDAVNGGYSPSNDALFVGKIVKDMYQLWYNTPVLTENGKPMMLNMQVHVKMDNAYWNGHEMFFGDGVSEFYPLVSLGVGAHEISHGFTEQHSNLAYYEQSGGLNESFSDMAAQAADYYATQKNNWMIGEEIFKEKDKALRYMDEPTKDCYGSKPGRECSISNAKNYNDDLDVHYSSGVFNKFFYLLSNSKNWDTHKAFDVMVTANQNYWTSTTSFVDAACGVLSAAKDHQYPMDAIKVAAKKVGIKTTKCKA